MEYNSPAVPETQHLKQRKQLVSLTDWRFKRVRCCVGFRAAIFLSDKINRIALNPTYIDIYYNRFTNRSMRRSASSIFSYAVA